MPKNEGQDRRGDITEIRRRYESLSRRFKAFPENVQAQESLANLKMYLDNIYVISDQFYKKGNDGKYPVVDNPSLDALSKVYKGALKACEDVLKAEGQTQEMTEFATEIKTLLNKDNVALETAIVNSETDYTLGEIIELGRSKTVDAGNEPIQASSGLMSARIPLNIEGLGDGFFTKNTLANPLEKMDNLYDRLSKKYPDMKDFIDILKEAGPDKTGSICVKNIDLLFQLGSQLSGKPDLPEDKAGMEAAAKKYYETMSASYIKNEDLNTAFQNPDFVPCMLEFSKEMGALITEWEMYTKDNPDGLSIEEGANIDKRNAAMSTMSALLGKKGLIAEAEPVIVVSNGVPTAGTFMKKSDGWEISNLDPKNPMSSEDASIYDNPEVFDDIAAIQALDYICGNIDRHEGNFFFTFKDVNGKKVISGVTGIDNDMSWGIISPSNNSAKIGNIFIRPENMGVIGEEVAAKILELDKAKLNLMLRGHGLSTAEIDSAWERTQHFQDEIRKGQDHYKDVEVGKIDKGFIRVVKKDEWQNYKLAELSKEENQFKVLSQMPEKRKKWIKDKDDENKTKEYETKVNREIYGIEPAEKKPFEFHKTTVVGEGLQAAENAFIKTGVENPDLIRVKVPGEEIIKVANIGGASNSRLPISYDAPDGKGKTGFFTASIYMDGKEKMRVKAEDLIASARKKGVAENELAVYRSLYETLKHNPDMFDMYLDNKMYQKPEILMRLGLNRTTAESLASDGQAFRRIRVFVSALSQAYNDIEDQYGNRIGIGADKQGTIDKRNVAFYKMSELLGTNVIPYTTNIEMESEGKITTGTFMETAKGVTMEKIRPGTPEAGMKEADFTGSALRDLADIEILDYICQNVDRNRGNFSFVYSPEGKCIGVVGIDNDLSFGTYDGDQRIMTQTFLSDITVMSEKMAERIRNMDPDALRKTLSGQELSQAEIDAAVTRFLNVQDKLEKGEISVIKDADWDKHTLSDLAGNKENIFKNVIENVIPLVKTYVEDGNEIKDTEYAKGNVVDDFTDEVKAATELRDMEKEADYDFVKSISDVVDALPEDKEIDRNSYINKSAEYLKILEGNLKTSDSVFFKSSPEFKNMKSEVKNLNQYVKNIQKEIKEGRNPIDKDLKAIMQGMKHIGILADSYTDYKNRQVKIEKRNYTRVEGLRLQTAENIKTVGESMSKAIQKGLKEEHRYDNSEAGITEKIQEIQKKLADNHFEETDYRMGIASLIYASGILKNVDKIRDANKIATALSDEVIEKNAKEIMKSPDFKKMMISNSKEKMLAYAQRFNGQPLFTEYVKQIATHKQKEQGKYKNVANQKKNEAKPQQMNNH